MGGVVKLKIRTLTELGARVRSLRIRRQMTQTQLAHAVGISSSQLSRIEAAQTDWSVQTLVAISRALEVPLEDFFSR